MDDGKEKAKTDQPNKRFDPFESDENLAHLFKYHAASDSDVGNYEAINRAALAFAIVLKRHVPACADRTAALRLIREARMTANAAVALKGVV